MSTIYAYIETQYDHARDDEAIYSTRTLGEKPHDWI